MADDPVETAEEGTATETAEDVAAETTETEEVETESATDDDAEGDDEAAASTETDVKYSRFRSVNERRKAAEQENRDLKAQLAALQPKKEEPAPLTTVDRLKRSLKPAPKDLDTLGQLEYYGLETLEQHADEVIGAWFEKKFGMKPEQAGATLSHATVSTREHIRSQFEQAAKAHGYDPTDKQVQTLVGLAMDSGQFKTFGEAMDAMRPKTAKTEARRVNGKGAESDSVDLTGLSRVRAMPLTKEDAARITKSGKRIENVSVTEILRESMKQQV